jgi:hypothetical protein
VSFRSQVSLKLTGLKTLKKHLQDGTGPVEEALRQNASLYRAFILRRFDSFSRGGGNWKLNTAARRRKKGHNQILVDTKFFRLRLEETIAVLRLQKDTAVVGFKSFVVHPNSELTLEQMAKIHNEGRGNNPKREILVEPDQATNRRRAAINAKIVAQYLRKHK